MYLKYNLYLKEWYALRTLHNMQQADLVNQIVAKVMAGLPAQMAQQNASVVKPVSHVVPNVSGSIIKPTTLKLDAKIITGDLIEAGFHGQQILEIPAKSLITPSAYDVIRKHKLSLVKPGTVNTIQSAGTIHKIAFSILHQTEISKSLVEYFIKQQSTLVKHLAGNHQEQVENIRSAICRGENQMMIALNKQPHRLACELNRHEQLRAIAIDKRETWEALGNDWRPNVTCITPEQQTFVGLRQLLLAILQTK